MAIYRLEKKSISRGNNHNLVAAVAYRAGAKFADTNIKNPDAKAHDYTKKTDVAHTEIVLPDELSEQFIQAGITLNIEQIANLVERGETTQRGKMKKTAKLANEYVLAGSHELSLDENIRAFREFAKKQSDEQGVIAMVFVHDPKHGHDIRAGKEVGDSGSSVKDLRNIHAHIIVLSRKLILTDNSTLKLGVKSDSELSNDERTNGRVCEKTGKILVVGRGLVTNSQWLHGVRASWADIQNRSLARHNIAPVTHKSYQDLGLGFKPTIHLGKNATALERHGIETYIGKYNATVNIENHATLGFTANNFIDGASRNIDSSERCIADAISDIEWSDDVIRTATGRIERCERRSIGDNNLIRKCVSPTDRAVPDIYTDRARDRAGERKYFADEIIERAKHFDNETQQYRDRAADAAAALGMEIYPKFIGRQHSQDFDERQKN